jgi:signal transduction histidine kinase
MRIEHRAPIVRIRITNPGTISAEEKQRMFERLYRGDDARNSAGSGLGLSIARAVTELHGGSLSIDGDISDTWVSVELPEHPKPST